MGGRISRFRWPDVVGMTGRMFRNTQLRAEYPFKRFVLAGLDAGRGAGSYHKALTPPSFLHFELCAAFVVAMIAVRPFGSRDGGKK